MANYSLNLGLMDGCVESTINRNWKSQKIILRKWRKFVIPKKLRKLSLGEKGKGFSSPNARKKTFRNDKNVQPIHTILNKKFPLSEELENCDRDRPQFMFLLSIRKAYAVAMLYVRRGNSRSIHKTVEFPSLNIYSFSICTFSSSLLFCNKRTIFYFDVIIFQKYTFGHVLCMKGHFFAE